MLNFFSAKSDDNKTHTPMREAILIIGILIVVSGFWINDPRRFISDDIYFYLEIARNLAQGKGQTFNEIYSTNGFHPLWLYLLMIWDKALLAVNPEVLKSANHPLPLSLALLWGTAGVLWKVAKTQRLNPAILIVPLIGYLGFFGHLYSELHLYVFLLSLLIYLLDAGKYKSARDGFIFGLLIGITFLARLDLAFVLLGLIITLWWRCNRSTYLMWVSAGAVSSVAPYLTANLFFFDSLLPVSGWLKSSFPQIYPLVHFRGLAYYSGASLELLGYNVTVGLIPIIVGAFTFMALRSRPGFVERFPIFLFFGVILHFAYTALFTRFATEWYWYYGAHQLLLAFSLAWLAREYNIQARTLQVVSLVIVIGVLGLEAKMRYGPENPDSAPLPVIRYIQEMGIKGQTIMVSDFPGRIAFDTENRVIATDMLTGNKSLIQEMQASDNALSHLVKLAAEKGKPVTYLFWVVAPCDWLVPNSDFTTIIYNNPKYIPERKKWGQLELGAPIFRDRHLAAWKITDKLK